VAAVQARLRAELRARWRAWCAIALMIGLTGGIVLSVAAGARRTETAYARFLRESSAAAVLLSPARTGLPGFYDDVARLPGVAAVGPIAGMPLALLEPSGEPNFDISVVAPIDGRLGVTVNRPKFLEGRPGRAERTNEVVISRDLAKSRRLRVGDSLRALTFTQDEEGQPEPSSVRTLTLRVVGIAVFQDDVVPITRLSAIPRLILTPAFFRAMGPAAIASGSLNFDAAFVRLDRGASVAAFRRGVAGLRAKHPELGETLFVSNEGDQAAKVEAAIRPQAVALGLFALLAGVAMLLVIGQLLGRQVFLDSVEHPTLGALGMTRRQLFCLALARVGGATLVGATLAVVVAAATSSLMPIGPARVAEPHPGFHVNAAVLAAGFASIVVLLLARAAVPAWRASRSEGGPGAAERAANESRSRLADAASHAGLPPSIATGVRMALEPGRGRTAVPVRGAVIGTALAVAAVTAALTFGTNLVRLVDTPSLYGQNWDVAVDASFGAFPAEDAIARLTANRDVAAFSGGTYGELTIEGRAVAAVGIDPLRGEALPTLLDGRWPTKTDEIALGTKVLRRLQRSVRDAVTVDFADGRRKLRVVGRVVFPAFGRGSFSPTGLGEGAAVTAGSLYQPTAEAPDPSYNFVLVRFRADVDRAAATSRLTRAVRAAGCLEGQCEIVTAQRPREISNYERVRGTPLILAAVLAALAVATLTHLLVSSIRRRRRDLAVLKTLGFERRQVSATVAWQATTLAALALLFGLPFGVASGRWMWAVFARQLGVSTVTVVPNLTVLLAVPITIVVANLAAAGPGWVAGRLRPATVLRTE
jgi:ABC-type antimicrobial peptide transport system permease subunit